MWTEDAYTARDATDGKLVLQLTPEPKGWYAVRAPFEPGLNTQARSISEAFDMAYDAMRELKLARKELAKNARKSA
ncbi:MAG: hypothetical protein QM770_00730 [Tepidisphaeraceae bacterium]